MIFFSSVKMAWESIRSNKMRSFLTMLGIIIGVAAVIILVSLVQGLSAQVSSMFESMGTTGVSVSAFSQYETRSFTYNDIEDFMWEHTDKMIGFVPNTRVEATLKYGGSNSDTTVNGVNEYYTTLSNLDTQLGRFINKVDVDNCSKVAVIGEYNAIECFGSVKEAIGKSIKINGLPFTVVGVAERKSDDVSQYSQDDAAYIPYSAAEKFLNSGNLSDFTLIAKSADTVDDVVALANEFMFGIYGSEDKYYVGSLKDMLDEYNSMMGTMSAALGGIAGISLLVAGIGIMNIMLVSVTERTREIGIRKSIGAKRSSILVQFVVEAMTLSLLGGIIGIIFGTVVAMVIGKIIDIPARPTVFIILLSLGFSSAVGLFFGFNPARKASKLNPIDALRSE